MKKCTVLPVWRFCLSIVGRFSIGSVPAGGLLLHAAQVFARTRMYAGYALTTSLDKPGLLAGARYE